MFSQCFRERYFSGSEAASSLRKHPCEGAFLGIVGVCTVDRYRVSVRWNGVEGSEVADLRFRLEELNPKPSSLSPKP